MSNSNFLDPSQLPAGKPQGQQATNQGELNTAVNVGDGGILPNQPNPHGLAGKVTNNHTGQNGTTHFGFKQVSLEQKQDKVAGVFHSVADGWNKINEKETEYDFPRLDANRFVAQLNRTVNE